jgi:acyl-coenzyme A thioesterase PaaI-like protein
VGHGLGRLAVMEATVFSEGHDEPVVHATGTYSIPPDTGK